MFPENVIQQAERDAAAARLADPNRNPFQRAQDFLRTRLRDLTAKPATKPLTSQQQVQADADAAARYSRKLQKAKNIKRLTDIRKAGTNIPLSGLGLALGAGGVIGKFMEDNFDVYDGGSGRGAGRSAFAASPEEVSTGKYRSRREGLENVYPERATPSYQSRREGLENVYPERYESNVEETKPTPTPEIASTFSSPFNVEINFEDFKNPSTDYLPGYKESDFRPGYRENPLTAGSMKGDHKFINPRQKAIMAREELTERSRERKAAEAFSESIGTKDLFKPDEFAKGTEIFEKGFLNNPDNFDYPGLFDPNTRTGI